MPFLDTRRLLAAALLTAAGMTSVSLALHAQPSSTSPLAPPVNGPRRTDPADGLLVFRNAIVHVKPGVTIENATLVIQAGRIVSVGPPDDPAAGGAGAIAAGARARDLAGLHIYPAFIEPYLEVDVPKPDGLAPGTHWNRRVTPERSAMDRGGRGIDEKTQEQLRSLGFGAVCITPKGGLIRGTSTLVSLAQSSGDPSDQQPRVYVDKVYQTLSLDPREGDDGGGGGGGGGRDERGDDLRWSRYPDSQMGAIALVRQTLSDAAWQTAAREKGGFDGPTTSIDALSPKTETQPGARKSVASLMLFDVDDELEALRAMKIAREFNRPAVILGSGREYRRLRAIEQTKASLIVPLDYPPRPRLGTSGEADSVELATLIAWEQAPTNLRRLEGAGLSVALTTSKVPEKLGGRGVFHQRLGQAIKHGLSADSALAMLTTNPAQMLGVSEKMGTLEAGKVASFIVADGPLFAEKPDAPKAGEPGFVKPGAIIDVWIDGQRHAIAPQASGGFDLGGTWKLGVEASPPAPSGVDFEMKVDDQQRATIVRNAKGLDGKPLVTISKVRELTVNEDGRISFVYDSVDVAGPAGDVKGTILVSGQLERRADGSVSLEATGQRALSSGVQSLRITGARPAKPAQAPNTPATAKPFVPTAESLAGTWTKVNKDGPAKPDDALQPVFELKSDKSIVIKLRSEELAGKNPVWETARDAEPAPEAKANPEQAKPEPVKPDPAKAEAAGAEAKAEARTVSVGGATAPPSESPVERIRVVIENLVLDPAQPPAVSAELILTPTKERTRLSCSIKLTPNAEAITFELARFVPTPESDEIRQIPERLGLPLGPYATLDLPEQQQVVIRNATIWTSGPAGIISQGIIGLQKGRIAFVAPADKAPELQGQWLEIDAKGKHITPGIIDCHSHTGISKGVNEAGQAVTAEVRIQDVTDPDSISWYRQLAGGVTSVNNLHGSANPIGGQNCVNKNRWGCLAPDDMHFEGAIAGIKFALGENVKQSNWGSSFTTRYPQTRMGVESLLRDRFIAAREYAAQWGRFAASEGDASLAELPVSFRAGLSRFVPAGDKLPSKGTLAKPRRDLELEALAEILAGTRLIHCHSYRQDEILMLSRIAREFGFKIGTYQHILEGYKVADVVRDYSGGGSSFSDWWNFKMEVQDAIPYSGPIMHEVGAVVSYNSDSDELARRLNVEAGKALKYGGPGMTPEEALKFVTLNPARQLRIDDRVGSLEVGKDADLVVWSGPPMSSMSRAERTYVDGRALFTLERDAALRASNEAERSRLIRKALAQEQREKSVEAPTTAANKDKDKEKDKPKPTTEQGDQSGQANQAALISSALRAGGGRGLLLAESLSQAQDARREMFMSLIKRGKDPRWTRTGECGCEVIAP